MKLIATQKNSLSREAASLQSVSTFVMVMIAKQNSKDCALHTIIRASTTVLTERVHPLSLDFDNQKKVVILRDVHDESWEAIAKKVRNLQNKPPSWKMCANVYAKFDTKQGKSRLDHAL